MTDGLTFREALPYLEACYRHAQELGIAFSYDDPLKIFVDPELIRHRDGLLHETAGCSAGKYMINVLTDGSVVPCPAFDVGVANIFRDTVENIFENNHVFRKLRIRGNHACSSEGVADLVTIGQSGSSPNMSPKDENDRERHPPHIFVYAHEEQA